MVQARVKSIVVGLAYKRWDLEIPLSIELLRRMVDGDLREHFSTTRLIHLELLDSRDDWFIDERLRSDDLQVLLEARNAFYTSLYWNSH